MTALLPAGSALAGNNTIYLLQLEVETPLIQGGLLEGGLTADLDVLGTENVATITQAGAALEVDLHVHGDNCLTEIHQDGIGEYASVYQNGSGNHLILSQSH